MLEVQDLGSQLPAPATMPASRCCPALVVMDPYPLEPQTDVNNFFFCELILAVASYHSSRKINTEPIKLEEAEASLKTK